MAPDPAPGGLDGDPRGGGFDTAHNIAAWAPLATNDVECPVCERSYAQRPPIQLLHALWHEGQNVGTPLVNAFPALLTVLSEQRWLTDDEFELWRQRLDKCPEYVDKPPGEHSGGRSWCAYCGDVGQYQTVVCDGCGDNFMRKNCPVYVDGAGRCIDCFHAWQEEIAAQVIAEHHTIPDQPDRRALP